MNKPRLRIFSVLSIRMPASCCMGTSWCCLQSEMTLFTSRVCSAPIGEVYSIFKPIWSGNLETHRQFTLKSPRV